MDHRKDKGRCQVEPKEQTQLAQQETKSLGMINNVRD
jgi:hypothetical protein